MTTALEIPETGTRQETARAARTCDLELVARVRNDEAGAFDELYRTYHHRIYAFALKRLRDPCEAEDVAQDVFLQIHRCIDRYEGRSSLQTWMFGIAYHEICSRFRRRDPLATTQGFDTSDLPARSAPIDDGVDAARTLADCARVLETRVSKAQRQAFEMHYWDNRSVKAIASRVGKSPEAVKIGLLRTRRALTATARGLSQILS